MGYFYNIKTLLKPFRKGRRKFCEFSSRGGGRFFFKTKGRDGKTKSASDE